MFVLAYMAIKSIQLLKLLNKCPEHKSTNRNWQLNTEPKAITVIDVDDVL